MHYWFEARPARPIPLPDLIYGSGDCTITWGVYEAFIERLSGSSIDQDETPPDVIAQIAPALRRETERHADLPNRRLVSHVSDGTYVTIGVLRDLTRLFEWATEHELVLRRSL
ncbi:MAG TPA: hypothetical protein VGD58_30710 [Herpetosiphonaceae bacterium]